MGANDGILPSLGFRRLLAIVVDYPKRGAPDAACAEVRLCSSTRPPYDNGSWSHRPACFWYNSLLGGQFFDPLSALKNGRGHTEAPRGPMLQRQQNLSASPQSHAAESYGAVRGFSEALLHPSASTGGWPRWFVFCTLLWVVRESGKISSADVSGQHHPHHHLCTDMSKHDTAFPLATLRACLNANR